ncbi:PucR family transcriptional regulator [Nitratireductor aquimarinus]|uniref:PucR family transcriptional regulator n=1 Tax=Nitratireductor aquimarinus TaxID=889300 RepID=UPI001A8EBA17|nr:PucR family transcriptional regulator [Nitratireductor aquimarinus]MBN8242436.1 PucR family transcriptional regulator [Nitratireductor aquimarinus]MBY6130823.1 PucR family transcriptional regulator [Nitratireductor aquimarinus]MCA1302422.1 PucR family transcriptional regulator [Nitratireductor aquimarinus]
MSLRIVDIVNMPELRTRFIGGDTGQEGQVQWAHVCELADPTEWLGKGDLLMTTGMGVPKSRAGQAAYVQRLSDAGLAGMMIGENMQGPKDMTALQASADRLGFPVLLTEYGVPFASVTRAVADAWRSRENDRRAAFARLHVSARMAIEGHDLAVLLDRLAQDVQAELMLWDGQAAALWLPRAVELSAGLRQILNRPLERGTAQAAIRRFPLKEGEVLAISIPSRQDYVLLARRSDSDLLDYSLMSHLASVLGIALEHRHVEHERSFRQNAELLKEIVGQKVKAGTLTRRLNACGLSLDAAILGVARADPLPLTEWARRFERLETSLLLLSRGQEVLVLLSSKDAEAVQAILGVPLGLSDSVHSADRMIEALREARLAAAHGTPERPVVHHAQIADRLPWLPQSIEEAWDTFRRILGAVAAHDEQSNARLLHTLRVFLEHNRSWQAAANALNIHKTSLTYRIRRVEELTGRSLSSTADVAALWLALQAADILGLPGPSDGEGYGPGN